MADWQALAIPEPNSGCLLWEGTLDSNAKIKARQQAERATRNA